MQFQYNADFPGVSGPGGLAATADAPRDFPAASPVPCARLTTRVYHPSRNQVATVQNVLVRTIPSTPQIRRQGSNSSMSSSDSDFSSSSSDDSMKLDTNPQQPPFSSSTSSNPNNTTQQPSSNQSQPPIVETAYWVQRTIREAIYGRVLFAVVLQKRSTPLDGAEWEVTGEHCAVKEMSWEHIRKERSRLAEDPIKEVSAMQFMKDWFDQVLRQHVPDVAASISDVQKSFQAMKETNIMMPLDLLSDERNLYSIMPYCDGGELFERLDMNERFSENEARYWLDQVLNGLENLQHMGICHRDMSLENLLVHKDRSLIIDMGMCLMIPYRDDNNGLMQQNSNTLNTASITTSMGQMNMNNTMSNQPSGPQVVDTSANGQPQLSTNNNGLPKQPIVSGRQRPRQLIKPQGTCGKWIYMSPEIYQNSEPFDGFAVDMWAAGVILFLMLTGFPPWERACGTDERFKYMTAGYLVQMLTEWEIGISADAMDLLQRMLFLDPKDRLSLDQVRAHPWMVNGPRQAPVVLPS